MRTFSHALMTAAAGKKIALPKNPMLFFLLGSVVPDLPLYVLTGVTMVLSPSWDIGMERMHANYETNLLWISLHNTFHSLVILGLLTLIAVFAKKQNFSRNLLWFSAAATIHTLIDIFTHAGDGPLFLFPLSLSVRFNSPISYWDPAYFGRPFSIFEYLLDIGFIIYLGFAYKKRRRLENT